MNISKWVLIDKSDGATTRDGAKLSRDALTRMADAVQAQVNHEFAAEWGAHVSIRVAKDPTDIQLGSEWSYTFFGTLPDAPDASAYHAIEKGEPCAVCALTTCGSLYGPDGVSVDVSHEILETAGDQGANQFANDNKGLLHAVEMCDAVEIQTYGKASHGNIVQVSNWLLRSWFNPGAAGPYDYMTLAHLPGAVSPPGPLKTAPGHGGNYQIIAKWSGDKQVFAIEGTRRKGPTPHLGSRSQRRMARLKNQG